MEVRAAGTDGVDAHQFGRIRAIQHLVVTAVQVEDAF